VMRRDTMGAAWFLLMSCHLCAGGPFAFERVPENATGREALVDGANPWGYWGEFARHPGPVCPRWRDKDDVVDGWDWSLPPGTEPSGRAMIRWGMHGWRRLAEAELPEGVTVVDELWWRWRQLEPEEGTYDFDSLKAAIRERLDAGCDGVIIRMLGSVWETGTPEEWKTWPEWRFGRWSAPRWLRDLGVKTIEQARDGGRVVHMDIFDPVYHEKYVRFVRAFGESGLPAMPELRGLIICGMSFSNGEEASDVKLDTPERTARWQERIRAWIDAFGDNRNKLVAMADLPSGAKGTDGDLMVGSRDGFVEMYLYHTNDPGRGQFIDKDRYLCVDETNPYVRQRFIFGDENEEYSPDRYADKAGTRGRFGPLESFNYRYFTSMLRMLQMRRNYLYTETNAVIPELLWYVCHELGHTAESAPDAWCFLRESYLAPWANAKQHQSPGPVKNFERWLHQRDATGHETEPAVRIPHALTTWWLRDEKHPYDYVARRGTHIGFSLDERILNGRDRPVAVKVTFFDGIRGSWRLTYRRNGEACESGPVDATGRDVFRTATLFLRADLGTEGLANDLEIRSADRVPISFVRVIPTD